jgi:hypothetical protein
MARACWMVNWGSTVRIRPLIRMVSGAWALRAVAARQRARSGFRVHF